MLIFYSFLLSFDLFLGNDLYLLLYSLGLLKPFFLILDTSVSIMNKNFDEWKDVDWGFVWDLNFSQDWKEMIESVRVVFQVVIMVVNTYVFKNTDNSFPRYLACSIGLHFVEKAEKHVYVESQDMFSLFSSGGSRRVDELTLFDFFKWLLSQAAVGQRKVFFVIVIHSCEWV